jgi:peptide-methionine (R)-S-oxide reductase
MEKITKSEDEWRQSLTSEQYYILRQKGTERPWTGPFLENKEKGVYECAGCGQELFSSATKFDSGCGWPSFYEPLQSDAIAYHRDTTHGMIRTEVTCARCGGHLGHVFDDGPQPTGQRYCINGGALGFGKR